MIEGRVAVVLCAAGTTTVNLTTTLSPDGILVNNPTKIYTFNDKLVGGAYNNIAVNQNITSQFRGVDNVNYLHNDSVPDNVTTTSNITSLIKKTSDCRWSWL